MAPMFISVLFTIATAGNQNEQSLTDEWIRKMWYYIDNGILFTLKKRNFIIWNAINEIGGQYTKGNVPGTERQILHESEKAELVEAESSRTVVSRGGERVELTERGDVSQTVHHAFC